MRNLRTVMSVLALCIPMPIGFFIRYTILATIHVDRLVWFLFWVDIPVSLLISIIFRVLDGEKKAVNQ